MSIKMVFNSLVTDSHDHDVEGVGKLRYESDGKVYRYVKNNDSANALSAGYFCTNTLAEGETKNQNVTLPITAGLQLFAGIVASTTLAANTGTLPKCFGWVQQAGPVTTAFLPAGTLALGTYFIPTNVQSGGTAYLLTQISTGSYTKFLEITTPGTLTTAGSTWGTVIATGNIVGVLGW